MSNQPNKTNGAKPAVRKKKNLLDDRRVRLALSVLGAIVAWMVVTIIVQPGTSNTIYNVRGRGHLLACRRPRRGRGQHGGRPHQLGHLLCGYAGDVPCPGARPSGLRRHVLCALPLVAGTLAAVLPGATGAVALV